MSNARVAQLERKVQYLEKKIQEADKRWNDFAQEWIQVRGALAQLEGGHARTWNFTNVLTEVIYRIGEKRRWWTDRTEMNDLVQKAFADLAQKSRENAQKIASAQKAGKDVSKLELVKGAADQAASGLDLNPKRQ